MNVVIDDAEEIYLKKKSKKAVGMYYFDYHPFIQSLIKCLCVRPHHA